MKTRNKTNWLLLLFLCAFAPLRETRAQTLDTTIINNIYNSFSHRWTANEEQQVLLIMADSIALAQHTASAGGNIYYPGTGLTLTTYTFGISPSYLAGQIHDSTQHYMLLDDSSYMASKVWAESYVAQHGGGGGGSGTVTGVASGYGLTGGTITTSGTLKVDTTSGTGSAKLATECYVILHIHDSTTNYVQLPDSNQSGHNNKGYATPAWVLQKGYGTGSLTSVAQTVPPWMSVSGTPITTSGTLAITTITQPVHVALMGGSTHQGNITPYFRGIFASDLPPSVDTSIIVSIPTALFNANNFSIVSSGNAGTSSISLVGVAVKKFFGGGTANQSTAAPAFRLIYGTDLPSGIDTAIVGTGSSGQVLTSNGSGYPGWVTPVSSVGLSLPGIFTVSGSPVTTTGTLTGALATQTIHKAFMGGSTNQGTITPYFRNIYASDLPATVDTSLIFTLPTVLFNSGTLTVSKSGNAGTGTLTLASVAVRKFFGGGTTNQSSAAPVYRTLYFNDLPNTLDTTHSAGTGLTDVSSGQNISFKITNVGTAGTYEYTTFNAQGQETAGTDTVVVAGAGIAILRGNTSLGVATMTVIATGGGGGGTDTAVVGSASINVTHPSSGPKVVSIIAPVTIANGGMGGTHISTDSIGVSDTTHCFINGYSQAIENDSTYYSSSFSTTGGCSWGRNIKVIYKNVADGEVIYTHYINKNSSKYCLLTFPSAAGTQYLLAPGCTGGIVNSTAFTGTTFYMTLTSGDQEYLITTRRMGTTYLIGIVNYK